jgi:tetratricopeptide (TPR) repeat protein
MENPPVPRLPPASELRSYSSSPPDFFSPITRYHADENSQQFVYDAWEATSVPQKCSLLREALSIFPFSVDALNAWADIYANKIHPPELEKAEKTYELALAAARLLWPDMEQKPSIEWGQIEHRPFLRACHGLAIIQNDLGKVDDAIEKYRFLLRVNPSDNQGVRSLLFNAFIETGDYQLAEEIAEKHSDGRKSLSVYFRYGFVIIDFLKFKLGVCSRVDLQDTLAQALMCNNFVPPLLLGDVPLPGRPDYVSAGSMNEAASVVHSSKGSWERVAGILEWLREQQYLGGKKPNGDGSILFKLLQKGKVLVNKRNPDALLELTTCVGTMPGTALPDFYLAPGMKEHNPAKIVAFNCKIDINVVGVPFWKILHASSTFGNEDEKEHSCMVCYKSASLRCSVCMVTWYCSKACQKKDWKAKHKVMCPKMIKT